ncbi:DUF3861 domain-containing protein [Pedobacter rhizosphaerae]|uniref:DUF3861 domain-containing protein n=1 Tax=Pedobacter rhizosphaerae TaxID=390241 RepID=A0A1H9U1Z6_9SPHI|nr:DUF3861 domain-containing protein [Pedobacter rhizosphaerae]SES03302.1 protein of unknown function [Pedobacter rhizosphaerae]
MINKKNNHYSIKLSEIELKDGTSSDRSITFEFDNHDNILDLIEQVKTKGLFESPEETTEFIVGLKLFSEVMLRNREHPLFEEFRPAFGEFMKKLKGKK